MKSTLQFYWRFLVRAFAESLAPMDLSPEPGKWERRNVLLRRAGLRIGRGSIIMPGMESLVGLHHLVSIGENCVLGPLVKLWAFHRLEIGACTVIGAECSFANGSHDLSTLEPSARPLIVGRGCRIGHGARIVGGVRIGDLAVIEPGSVVTTDVAEAAIVGGVPARVIGQRKIAAHEYLWGDRWYCPRVFEILPPPTVGVAQHASAS